MAVFDWTKAVIEKELFEGGDPLKPTEFVKEQTKLHSLNKLSGRIFNPYGIINTISDSDNPFVSQLIARGASDILQAGAYETRDGILFNRTADNNADELFFENVSDFKQDIQGGQTNLLNSLTRKAVNGIINRIGQLAGIETKATRSILAQTIAYNSNLVDGNGSQSLFPEMYSDSKIDRKSTIEIEPIGEQALPYTHDIISMRSRIEEILRLKRKINDGFFAQNVAVKKPQSILDIENNTLGESVKRNMFQSKALNNLRYLIESPQPNTNEYWTNRQKQYESFRNDFYIGSKQRKLNDNFLDSYKYIVASALNMNSSAELSTYFDFLHDQMLEDYENYMGDDENLNTDLERRRLDKLNNNSNTRKISSESGSNSLKYYTNISNRYKIGSDESQQLKSGGAFTTYKNAYTDPILDELSESDIIVANNRNSEDVLIGDTESSEYMYFALQDVRNNHIIFLQPTVQSITEDIQPTYTEKNYLGRTESLPSYERTTRSINLSFKLSARTPKELIMIYRKLNFIHKLTYPKISQNFKKSQTPISRITLGDYYKNTGGYVTSFTKSVDNDSSTWETEVGYRVPKTIDCSLSFIILHETMPYVDDDDEFANNLNIHKLNLDTNV